MRIKSIEYCNEYRALFQVRWRDTTAFPRAREWSPKTNLTTKDTKEHGGTAKDQSSSSRMRCVVALCLGLASDFFFLVFSTRRVGGTAPICARDMDLTAVTAVKRLGFFLATAKS